MLRDDRKLTKMPLWTDCWTAKSHITLLKAQPGSFNAATQRAIALDAISKAESSRLRGRRNGHVRWTKGEQDHDESVTADFRALNTSLSSGFNQMIEFQTGSCNKMLDHKSDIHRSWRRSLRLKQNFYPNQVKPDSRVEVQEDRKAFDPERLRCSAIIAASLGTCQISVHRKEQYNRVCPQT